MAKKPKKSSGLSRINHFIVLMLENRSFDHFLGSLKKNGMPDVDGLTGDEFNYENPQMPRFSRKIKVSPDAPFAMEFDPGHEFDDVHEQLFGTHGAVGVPANMGGFVASAQNAAHDYDRAGAVMKYFTPENLPVLGQLAREFTVCDHWHSSLPGPTWPNRFFAHAATSGGLTASPSDSQIILGYGFKKGTIYDRLKAKNKKWRIYHDGFPQSAGIADLRLEFLNPLTDCFRGIEHFTGDIEALQNSADAHKFPSYVFIEPRYGNGNFQSGNSQHPLDDVRNGEALIKLVYETIRNSPLWADSLLVVTYDEHGGFYDHVPPPPAVATGDDQKYSTEPFDFKRLGVRVPAVLVSPFVEKGKVIHGLFDHSSILKTLEDRFGLSNLTQRDLHAESLAGALSLDMPRADSPEWLEKPISIGIWEKVRAYFRPKEGPLTPNQTAFLHLGMACDMQMEKDGSKRHDIHRRVRQIFTQKAAGEYLSEAEERLKKHRQNPTAI